MRFDILNFVRFFYPYENQFDGGVNRTFTVNMPISAVAVPMFGIQSTTGTDPPNVL